MKKSLEMLLDDEAAMRSFYELCGISPEVAEAAIKMRKEHPVELEKEAHRQRCRQKLVNDK